MKIVDIRTTPLSYRCEPPYGSAGGMQARRGGLLVEIETDERVIGIGEAGVGGGATQGVIEKLLTPMLIGEDPLLIEGLWQKMFARTRQFGRRGIVMNAISGIDIALWDIAGKVAKLPLYRLFGGCRDRVEAYASGGFYQEGKSIDDLAGEAEGYRARGFKGMKMKIGRNPSTQNHLRHLVDHAEICEVEPEEDIVRVEAVRQALGSKVKLMVDVNCAWSPSLAIEMGRALEPYKLYLDRGAGRDRRHRRQRQGRRCARHSYRWLRDRNRALRVPRADHPRRRRHRPARHRLGRRVLRMPPHRRPGAGASSHGRAARLRQRGDIGRRAAFHRLDPEWAGARIRPEPQRPAR
jgi:hypothetical protein